MNVGLAEVLAGRLGCLKAYRTLVQTPGKADTITVSDLAQLRGAVVKLGGGAGPWGS